MGTDFWTGPEEDRCLWTEDLSPLLSAGSRSALLTLFCPSAGVISGIIADFLISGKIFSPVRWPTGLAALSCLLATAGVFEPI